MPFRSTLGALTASVAPIYFGFGATACSSGSLTVDLEPQLAPWVPFSFQRIPDDTLSGAPASFIVLPPPPDGGLSLDWSP